MSNYGLNIPKIYENPILFRERLGTAIMPFRKIKESMTVTQEGYALLTEVPNKRDRVKVTGLNREFHETEDDFLKENYFKVDYINGWVFFHESLIGRTLNFEYTGKGVYLIPDSRVYHTGEGSFPTVKDKFVDVDRAILVERNRITEQIISHPQPSEVVDARIDYNGKIYDITKHRIDAEQKKIEEAYVDARGKRFDSLKLRIDSLQLATEEIQDEQGQENKRIWASIDLIPGRIELETGKLEEKINGDLRLLQSKISMIPEQLELSVSEVRQWVDGRVSTAESSLKLLSDRMELKVDVDGVTSAINLSKEGVRIDGNKIWINGKTKIDDAVITSAMIKNLDVSKLTAGTISTDSIRVFGGTKDKYALIEGSLIESRGRFTREWFGVKTTYDVKLKMENGYFRARNDTLDRSLYFSEFGISTYMDGAGDYVDANGASSGSLIWWDGRYSPSGVNGITLNSYGGVVALKSDRNRIVIDSYNSANIESRESPVYIRPYTKARTGNNTFNFTVLDRDAARDTDGVIMYGSEVNGYGVGLRWSKAASDPVISVVDTKYERGGNTTFDVGNLKVNNITKRNSNTSVYWNGTSGGSTGSGVSSNTLRASGIRTNSGDRDLFLATDNGGTVRVTDAFGYNQGRGITYRSIAARDFVTISSEKHKENISPWNINALDEIRKSVLYSYTMKNEETDAPKIRHGFITERETPSSIKEGDSISQYELSSLNAKAIQELDREVFAELRELKVKYAKIKKQLNELLNKK